MLNGEVSFRNRPAPPRAKAAAIGLELKFAVLPYVAMRRRTVVRTGPAYLRNSAQNADYAIVIVFQTAQLGTNQ